MKYNIKSLDELEQVELQVDLPTYITYKSNYFEYNILVYFRPAYDNVVVFSNGAVNFDKKSPPIFMRSSWQSEIESNLIFLDDGTIHNTNLNLGWGQGNTKEFVLEIYSEIIKKILNKMTITSNNTNYYGSSAGGFMSLLLASMHKSSRAIVNNPQTDINSYYKKHSSPLLELSYGSVENAYLNFKHRVNVINAFEYFDNIPNIYYLQNQMSKDDIELHLTPFINKLKNFDFNFERVIFINYFDKIKGHSPLDKEAAISSINLFIREKIF